VSAIRDKLEALVRRHPGGTGEGVRLALAVLDETTCHTCKHCGTVEASDAFGYCGKLGNVYVPNEHFCAHWEPTE
jgi:hypothetical protein